MALQISIFLKDQMTKGMKNVTKGIKNATSATIKWGAASALLFGTAAVKKAADYEKQIAEIQTLMGDMTEGEVRALREELSGLAIASGQSLKALSKARYDIVSSGITEMNDAFFVTEQATKLAVAGVTDAANATDLLTSAINAYGFKASEAQNISDILFTTVRLGKTTVTELAGSLGTVFSTARAANLSLDDLGAAMATTTAAGLDSAMSATSLRSALVNLVGPAQEAKKWMKLAGIEVKNFDDGTMDLVSTMRQFSGMDLEEIQRFIPNIRAANAVLILSQNIDKLTTNIEEMNDVAGATEQAYDTMLETFSTKMAQLRENFNKVFTDIGSDIIDVISPYITQFNEELEKIGTEIGWDNIAEAILGNIDTIFTAAGQLALVGGKFVAQQAAKGLQTVGEQLVDAINEGIERAKKRREAFNLMENVEKAIEAGKKLQEKQKTTGRVSAESLEKIAKKYNLTYNELANLLYNQADVEEFVRKRIQKEYKSSEKNTEDYATQMKKILSGLYSDIKKDAEDAEDAKLEDAIQFGKDGKIDIQTDPIIQEMDKIGEKGKQTAKELEDSTLSVGQSMAYIVAKFVDENQMMLEGMSNVINQVGSVVDGLISLREQQIETQTEASIALAEKEADAKIAAIKRSGRSEEEQADLIANVQENLANKEDQIRTDGEASAKDYAKKMQAIQIGQAIAGTAMAVINALQMQPWPVAVASAILAGTMGGIEVAKIKSQNFALAGQVTPISDTVPARLTPGESINTVQATEMNRDEIRDMNNRAESGRSMKNNQNNVVIYAMDGLSLERFLKQNPDALTKGMNHAKKLGYK